MFQIIRISCLLAVFIKDADGDGVPDAQDTDDDNDGIPDDQEGKKV